MTSSVRVAIAHELGVKPSIDPADETRRRVAFLADYLSVSYLRGRMFPQGTSKAADLLCRTSLTTVGGGP